MQRSWILLASVALQYATASRVAQVRADEENRQVSLSNGTDEAKLYHEQLKAVEMCTPRAVLKMCNVIGASDPVSETGEAPSSSIDKLASALAVSSGKAHDFMDFLGLSGISVDCAELCQAMVTSVNSALHQALPPQLGEGCVSDDCSEVLPLTVDEMLEDDLVSVGEKGELHEEEPVAEPVASESGEEEMSKLLRVALVVLLDTVPDNVPDTSSGSSFLQDSKKKPPATFDDSIPSSKHSDTKRATLKAANWVKEAIQKIDSQTRIVRKWFKLEDASDKQVERRSREVKKRLADMLDSLTQVHYTKGSSSKCTSQTLAYVMKEGGQGTMKGSRYIIQLCDHFWEVSYTEQVSTLIHEVSHHFGTIDAKLPNGKWAYGETKCLQLDSENAARNADTYLFAVRDIAKAQSFSNSGLTGDARIEDLKSKIFELVGLKDVKDSMRTLLDLVEFGKMREQQGLSSFSGQSLHMRFLGNPGTGKTVVARLVGELLLAMGAITPKDNKTADGFVFKEASRADLVGEYTGATALKVQKVVQEALGGVLFIDEAYALVQGSRDSFGVEAVDTLIKEMEDNRAHLIVILAGYTKEMDDFFNSNPGFRSRVPFSFSFEDYTCPELVRIGQLQMRSKAMELKGTGCEAGSTCWWIRRSAQLSTHCCDEEDKSKCTGEKSDDRSNGNGRTVRNLLESSFRHMALRVLKRNEPKKLKEFSEALTAASPAAPVCKGAVPEINLGAGYSGGDLRCVFSLLEGSDVLATTVDIVNLNIAPCEMTAVTSNQTTRLAYDAGAWTQLGTAIQKITAAKQKGGQALAAACATLPSSLSAGGSLLQLSDRATDSDEADVSEAVDGVPRGYVMMPDPGKCQDGSGRTITYDIKKRGFDLHECVSFCDHKLLCKGFQWAPGGCDIYTQQIPRMSDGRARGGLQCYVKESAAATSGVPLPAKASRPPKDHRSSGRPTGGTGRRPYRPPAHARPTRPTHATRAPVIPETPFKGGARGTKADVEKAIEEAAVPGGANEKVDALMAKLNRLVGLSKVKAGMSELRAMVEFDLWRKKFLPDAKSLMGQSFHMQFLGNPGTGKTVVARLVGELLVEMGVIEKEGDETVFHEVSRADLVAEYKGQTAPKVMAAVEKAIGGVLFIDEAYSLKKEGKDAFGQEAVDTLIKEIEDKRDKVIAIFAGYDKEMDVFFEANPGFKSRVPFKFYFDDYSCDELSHISGVFLEDKGFTASESAQMWLNRTIRFATGCCEDQDAGDDSGASNCKARRDSGNGRTVRNILEGGYRNFAARVVPTLYKDPNVRTVLEHVEKYAKAKEEKKHDYELRFGKGKLAMKRLERKYGTDAACSGEWKEKCLDAGKRLTKLEGEDIVLVHAQLASDAMLVPCRKAKRDLNEFSALTESALQAMTEEQWNGFVNDIHFYNDCDASFQDLKAVQNPPPAPKYDSLPLMEESEDLRPLLAKLQKLVGLTSVKEAMGKLFGLVKLSSWRTSLGMTSLEGQSFHMRFLGNPGTGKTVVARIVGEMMVKMGVVEMPQEQKEKLEAEAKNRSKQVGHDVAPELVFREASRADLVAQYLGQTAPKVERSVADALGGVLFIDEAYALVRESKDSFGQEAVDTLIKEMEDKRKNVIVILAGYETEMDTFFESNPGFKSRVPFSFRFEDYSCPELGQIGNLVLSSQGLSVTDTVNTQLTDLISFASGCCTDIAAPDCHPSRDNGNGRTVRNVVEALQRAMARRVVRSKTRSAEALGTLMGEDVMAVAEEQARTRLEGPCGSEGLVSQLAKAASKKEGLRYWFDQYKLSNPEKQLHRMVRETGRLSKMASFYSPYLDELKKGCTGGLDGLVRKMNRKIRVTCEQYLPQLASEMNHTNKLTVAEFETTVQAVQVASKEAVLMLRLLNKEDTPAPLDTLKEAVSTCEPRLDELKDTSVMAPLESLVAVLNDF